MPIKSTLTLFAFELAACLAINIAPEAQCNWVSYRASPFGEFIKEHEHNLSLFPRKTLNSPFLLFVAKGAFWDWIVEERCYVNCLISLQCIGTVGLVNPICLLRILVFAYIRFLSCSVSSGKAPAPFSRSWPSSAFPLSVYLGKNGHSRIRRVMIWQCPVQGKQRSSVRTIEHRWIQGAGVKVSDRI